MFGFWEGSIVAMVILLALVPYIWLAVCLMVIAKKTGTPDGWLAFIPILNIYLLCKVAGHSGWWALAILFVPLVNIITTIWFWVEIARRRNHPEWLGILMIIPLVNFIIPGIIAFSDNEAPAAVMP